MPEPAATRPSFPVWTSRGGEPIAKGSGFFGTAQVDNRWWLVDPEGKPFFDVGTDHVNYNAHWCEALGYAPYHRNVAAKFGSEESWAASAIQRLTAWGFNTLPAGHTPSLRHHGLPHILFASFGSSFARREWISEPIHWTGFPDVFSPRWATHCRIVARKLAAEGRGDPWCIGTFLDNELEWYGKKGNLVDEVFRLEPQRPAKTALYDWLLKRYGSLGEVNRRLGWQYADRQAFWPPGRRPRPRPRPTRFAPASWRKSPSVTSAWPPGPCGRPIPSIWCWAAVLRAGPPEPALPAAGKYNDVFTFNTYPRVDFQNAWQADGAGGVVQRVPRELSAMYAVVRRPMIITEWSFPALDSGLPCKHGAGMRVDTQEQKAACYRIFAHAMADLPFMVGYHYFMWADEPAPGISSTFPEDSNYGLVNEKDEPYELLVKAATEANGAAAARHARSLFSGDLELRAAGDAAELTNTTAQPARGLLRIVAGGRSRVEEVTLPPHGTRRVAIGAATAWCAELQQWDGTQQRCLGGPRLAPLEVANVSAAAVDGVPLVIDGPPVMATYVSHLEPGHTQALAPATAALAEVERLELKADGVIWRAGRRDGSLFDAVQAGDLPLGRLVFAAHQQLDGHDLWTEANRVVSLRAQEQAEAWVIEAVVERTGPQGAGRPNSGPGCGRPCSRREASRWSSRCGWKTPTPAPGSLPMPSGSAARPSAARRRTTWWAGPACPTTTARPSSAPTASWAAVSARWARPAAGKRRSGPIPTGRSIPTRTGRWSNACGRASAWTAEGVAYLWIFAARQAADWHTAADRQQQAAGLLTAENKP